MQLLQGVAIPAAKFFASHGCILLQHPSSQTKHKALLHFVTIIIIMIHHVPDIQGVGIVQLFILCLKTKDSLKLYLHPCYKVWAAPC